MVVNYASDTLKLVKILPSNFVVEQLLACEIKHFATSFDARSKALTSTDENHPASF
tara:strand:+ start:512 stop:679 length:168 start_codon:yes stop_codon:yes gene_type:complete